MNPPLALAQEITMLRLLLRLFVAKQMLRAIGAPFRLFWSSVKTSRYRKDMWS